jgi:FixJ family two-component response regulator
MYVVRCICETGLAPSYALRSPAESHLRANTLITVVDDDEDFRLSMRSLMESLGFIAEAFPSAADFLTSRTIRDTDCLIADVHMPRMTGLELHRHLIQAGHAIPTILITAYPDDTVRDRALRQGVVCYLPKTIDEDGLLSCIRLALEQATPDSNPS